MKSIGFFYGIIKIFKGPEVSVDHLDDPACTKTRSPGSFRLPWPIPAACPDVSLALLSGKTRLCFVPNPFVTQ